MAMAAPGRGLFSGTTSCRKTFRNSQAQRLRLVPAKAGIGEKLPIIQEVLAQDLRDAQDKMSMGNLFENVPAQPFNRDLENTGVLPT